MGGEEQLEIVFQELRRNKQPFVTCMKVESSSTAFPECLLWIIVIYNCRVACKCMSSDLPGKTYIKDV